MDSVHGFGGFIDGMEIVGSILPYEEILAERARLSRYNEGELIPEITKADHDRFLEQYKHIATELGTVRVEPGEPLPDFEEIVAPYSRNGIKPGHELWIGPPSEFRLRKKRVGVWDLEVGEIPEKVLDKAVLDEDERDPFKMARSIIGHYFDEGVLAADTTAEAKARMARQLQRQGFIEIGQRALNYMIGIPSHDEVVAPFIEHVGQRLVVGPPAKVGVNDRATLGVWSFSAERNELLKVDHINPLSLTGYPLEVRPTRIPAEEKKTLVDNLLARRLVPGARKLGLRPFSDQPDPTARELISDITDRHKVEQLMKDLRNREDGLAIGPAICVAKIKDGTTRYVVKSGDSIAIWQYVPKSDRSRDNELRRLRRANEKGHIVSE